MSEWVTYEQAAKILGCHISYVPKLIRKGQLSTRSHRANRRLPSLKREEVQALTAARALAAEQRTREAQRRTESRRRVRRPPDDEHEWLRVSEVSRLLGITSAAVHQRARRERLPAKLSDGLRWIRRDHLEQVEAARLVRKTRRP